MKKLRNNLFLSIILITASAVIYFIQYTIFKQPENTWFYFLQDLAFVPFQALFVTLVINRFLNIAEERNKIKKTNVIISTFFVDAGVDIIKSMSCFNRNHNQACEVITIQELNGDKSNILKQINNLTYDFYADPEKLENLAVLMNEKRPMLISLLENNNLLEHESFTDMMWAVFHVADELLSRGEVKSLSNDDINHISNDLLRAYTAMVKEWVKYMIYLKKEYPYLYTFALKKNPFEPVY